jgi:hypothetical protein
MKCFEKKWTRVDWWTHIIPLYLCVVGSCPLLWITPPCIQNYWWWNCSGSICYLGRRHRMSMQSVSFAACVWRGDMLQRSYCSSFLKSPFLLRTVVVQGLEIYALLCECYHHSSNLILMRIWWWCCSTDNAPLSCQMLLSCVVHRSKMTSWCVFGDYRKFSVELMHIPMCFGNRC